MAAFLENTRIWENITSYLVYFLFVAYFLGIFVLTTKDQTALDNNKNIMYLFSIIIPLVAFTYMIFSNVGETQMFMFLACITIFLSIFLFRSAIPSSDKIINDSMLYFTGFSNLPMVSDQTSFLVSLSLNLLFIIITIIFLSIVFSVFLEGSFRQKGRLNVYLYAIFFIPCLVSDYFKYLFNEIRTTPNIVFSLIILEIVLVLLYVYIPKLLLKVVHTNSNQILQNPMQLYTKKRVGKKEDFYNITKDLKEIRNTFKNDAPTYMKNYSLSMWITLNPPTFSKETECMILRLGSDHEGTLSDPDNPRIGAPYIGCKGSKLRVVFSNNVYKKGYKNKKDESMIIDSEKLLTVSTEVNVPFQTWNFFVFNYHDNQVDLFINGMLTETKSLASNLPIYENSQVFCVGSNTNLLHGAVCDIRVQPEMLNQTQISQTYNLLKLQNPPVNNIL